MTKSIHDMQVGIIKQVLMNCHASLAHCDRENGVSKFRIFPIGPFAGDPPLILLVSDHGCSLDFKLFGRRATLTGLNGVIAGIRNKAQVK